MYRGFPQVILIVCWVEQLVYRKLKCALSLLTTHRFDRQVPA